MIGTEMRQAAGACKRAWAVRFHMIVAGSMIGSGISSFQRTSHQVKSPGFWLRCGWFTGVMTLIGALSYGELAAAMLTRWAYVYLRESLGRFWVSLRLDHALVIQTATIEPWHCLRKFTAVILPWFSASDWIWKNRDVRSWQMWFGSLGP